MTLSDFYDRLKTTGALSEGEARMRLEEALEVVSNEAGVPRVLVGVPVADDGTGAVAVTVAIRRFLTPKTGPCVPLPRMRAATWSDIDLAPYPAGTKDVVFCDGASDTFEIEFEGLPPAVPLAESEPDWEVPFADACLNYILSELLVGIDPVRGRLHYARYEQAKLRLKQDARMGFQPTDLTPYPESPNGPMP